MILLLQVHTKIIHIHFENESFVLCSEVVPISKVQLSNNVSIIIIWVNNHDCEHILNVEKKWLWIQ